MSDNEFIAMTAARIKQEIECLEVTIGLLKEDGVPQATIDKFEAKRTRALEAHFARSTAEAQGGSSSDDRAGPSGIGAGADTAPEPPSGGAAPPAPVPAAAPAQPLARPPSALVKKFLADLSEGGKDAKRDEYWAVLESQHADTLRSVAKNLDPRTIFDDVMDAKFAQTGHRHGETTKPQVVLVNGDVQRGKTIVKIRTAVVTKIVNDDPETRDRCYTMWCTIQVPWAEQAMTSIQRATKGKFASQSEGGSNNGASQGYESDPSEDDEDGDSTLEEEWDGTVSDLVGEDPGIPCSMCNNEMRYQAAKEVAKQGGIVVFPRTKGSLQKAYRLKYELNQEAKVKKESAISCILDLDEVDKMLGSCNWAGYENDNFLKISVCERYLFALMGIMDANRPGERAVEKVVVFTQDGEKTKIEAKARVARPFFICGISATNVGTFMFFLHRIGTQFSGGGERFNLLDCVSFKEAEAEAYISLLDTLKYKGLVIDPKEISTENNFVCSKILAMESAAAQKSGAGLMIATTNTVNADVRRGVPSTRVGAETAAQMLIDGKRNVVLHNQPIGYGPGGMTTLYMHGNNKTFEGMIGVEHVAPDDVCGLKYVEKLRGLVNEKMVSFRDEKNALQQEIDEGNPTATLKKRFKRAKFYYEDLRQSRKQFDKRLAQARKDDAEINQMVNDAVALYKQAKKARQLFLAENAKPEAERKTQLEIEALEARYGLLDQQAEDSKAFASERRFELAHNPGDSDPKGFKKSFVFGVEVLRPLIMLWEEEKQQIDSGYVKQLPMPKQRQRFKPELWCPVIRAAMISTVISFLRTRDDNETMAALYSRGEYASPTVHTNSRNVPIAVRGYGMLRRAMSIVGAQPTAPGVTEALMTLTHVIQYAVNMDGASVAQQAERFATNLTEYIRQQMGDCKIEVLCTEKGWLAMRGHWGYNSVPLFRQPDAARKPAIKKMVALIKGEEQLPVHGATAEAHFQRLADVEIETRKNESITMTARNERIMRVLANTMTIPQELYEMCLMMKNCMFDGTKGVDYRAVLVGAAEGQDYINGRAARTVSIAQPPQKKRKATEHRRDYFGEWAVEALEALGAKAPVVGGDLRADQVGTHGEIWAKMIEAHGWKLNDPAEMKKLTDANIAESSIIRTLTNDGRDYRQGIGFILKKVVQKNLVAKVDKFNPRNPYDQNAYFIPTDAPSASQAAAAATAAVAGSSSRGRSAAAAGEAARRAAMNDADADDMSDDSSDAERKKRKRGKRPVVIEDESSEEEDGYAALAEEEEDYDDDDDDEELEEADPAADAEMVDEETPAVQQAAYSVTYNFQLSQLCKPKNVKERVTDSNKLHPLLPAGWTQWVGYRPDGKPYPVFLSPDGKFLTDRPRASAAGRKKAGFLDWMPGITSKF